MASKACEFATPNDEATFFHGRNFRLGKGDDRFLCSKIYTSKFELQNSIGAFEFLCEIYSVNFEFLPTLANSQFGL